MRRSAAFAAILAVLLSGCGGGVRSVMPGGSGAAQLRPQNTNIDLFAGTLWYGDGTSVHGVPLAANGAPAKIQGNFTGSGDHLARAIDIGPEGTIYELDATDSGTRWRLQTYAPGSSGSAGPQHIFTGTGTPLQVALVGDGIEVLSVSGTPKAVGSSATLSTFAYGVDDYSSPIRTLALGESVSDVAVDGDGWIYVAHYGGRGITVFPPRACDGAAPRRTIASNIVAIAAVAVADDGTVYARDGLSPKVGAYAPGSNGPDPSRSFDLSSDAVGPEGGITVDSKGNVYAGIQDVGGNTRVDAYPPGMRGSGAPVRTIATPTAYGFVGSIAIGPAIVAESLYVASQDRVNVFASDANGPATPQRQITSVYDPGGPGNNARPASRASGVAAGANGTLVVLETIRPKNSLPLNAVAVYAPDANGGTNPQARFTQTGGYAGIAIARVPGTPGYDVLAAASPTYVVDTFPGDNQQNGLFSTVQLTPRSAPPNGIAVDSELNVYVSSSNPGVVNVYAPGSRGPATPVRSLSFKRSDGPIAIGPDDTLYVAAHDGMQSPLNYIYSFAKGWTASSAPLCRLGPFSTSTAPGIPVALAVDAQSQLYVALNYAGAGGPSNAVEVFAPGSCGPPAPARTLQNPIAPGDPLGGTIVSIAVGS